jgi:hypothetical protein
MDVRAIAQAMLWAMVVSDPPLAPITAMIVRPAWRPAENSPQIARTTSSVPTGEQVSLIPRRIIAVSSVVVPPIRPRVPASHTSAADRGRRISSPRLSVSITATLGVGEPP